MELKLVEQQGDWVCYEWEQTYLCKHKKILSYSGSGPERVKEEAETMRDQLEFVECPISDARKKRYSKRLFI